METITLDRQKVKKAGGMVVLTIKEYRKLLELSVPTYYLAGKEAEELDRLVEGGLRDYKEGKTIKASSIDEAMKIYASTKKKSKR